MMAESLAHMGIPCDKGKLHVDWCPARLVEYAVAHGEGVLSSTGALVVKTGAFTGRSPESRYIVDAPSVHDFVAWGSPANRPLDEEGFELLRAGVSRYLSNGDVFVVRGFVGADRAYARKVLVVAERASHALFMHQMLVRPTREELDNFGAPDIVLLSAPGYACRPEDGVEGEAAVALDFAQRAIVVAGTGYAGEMKKAVFTMMSYLLPVEDGVLPMHCSATMDARTGKTAVLFGLSGTGKTTLSADPGRLLIGDDEHGWSPQGVFNLEGGCYAKCIDLTREREPEIFDAVRFGSVAENVVLGKRTRAARYADASITQNTRVAYPLEHIAGACATGTGEAPSVILFLTADAYGVLPPISRLDRKGAMFHFLTGYTSKVAGTEQGVVEPQPTFSALFGEPFMPLDHMVYAYLLGEKIARHETRVYLVNTGWTAGGYGEGHRIALFHTRALVAAALDGSLDYAGYRHDRTFDVDVPRECPGVPTELLVPRKIWDDKRAYDEAASRLARLFRENFERRYPGISLDDLLATEEE